MSQLDSMLTELKKSTSNGNGSEQANDGPSQAELQTQLAAQSQSLKSFLQKNASAQMNIKADANDDPQVILQRRSALSSFVGIPLTNNGNAALSGTISAPLGPEEAHGGHGGHGQKPAHGKQEVKQEPPPAPLPPPQLPPPVVVQYIEKPCDKCKDLESKLKEAQAEAAKLAEATKAAASNSSISNPGAGMGSMGGMGFSRPVAPAQAAAPAHTPAQTSAPVAPPTPEPQKGAEAKTDPKQGKSAMSALFGVFGGNKDKQEPQKHESKPSAAVAAAPQVQAAPAEPAPAVHTPTPVAAPATTPAPAASAHAAHVTWFKHIQAVESAIRIGDMHFADCLLTLLMEVVDSVSAPDNIRIRLSSMQARVMIDRKQFKEAHELLEKCIKEAQGTEMAKNVAIAYCWYTLAQNFQAQKMADKAEQAHQKAISVAEAALGPNDPETMLLKAPLQ